MDLAEQLKRRTKTVAIKIIKLCRLLPNSSEFWIIQKQIIRSGTSVAANYRAVCRARSDNEFYSKLCIVVEELDETLFWLELLLDLETLNPNEIREIESEVKELLSMLALSKKSMRLRLNTQ